MMIGENYNANGGKEVFLAEFFLIEDGILSEKFFKARGTLFHVIEE